MASPAKKTNFKTYEASTRLLAAVIASTNVKLDFAKLAQLVGGGVTKDSVDHRLRPIKQLAKMQQQCVDEGEDPGKLPIEKGGVKLLAIVLHYLTQIQRLFGESTPGGIEWRLREIKTLGKSQQAAVDNGEDPASLLAQGTPSAGRRRGPNARTPASGATPQTPSTTASGGRGRKRKELVGLAPLDSSSDKGDDGSDFEMQETPSKRPTKKTKTAAAAANANGNAKKPVKTTNGGSGSIAVLTANGLTSSIFGNGGDTAAVNSTEAANDEGIRSNGRAGQSKTPGSKSAAKETKIKSEVAASNPNPFEANNGSSFDYEDGEI
ncbi:hypothetical protein F4777DRAFT_592042 [Nemania sp. FL0916]|nr:hypothetical protein F4777DRAFT_592042 [Nemania sp. FL0916]